MERQSLGIADGDYQSVYTLGVLLPVAGSPTACSYVVSAGQNNVAVPVVFAEEVVLDGDDGFRVAESGEIYRAEEPVHLGLEPSHEGRPPGVDAEYRQKAEAVLAACEAARLAERFGRVVDQVPSVVVIGREGEVDVN